MNNPRTLLSLRGICPFKRVGTILAVACALVTGGQRRTDASQPLRQTKRTRVSVVLSAFIGLTILSYGVYVALAAPLLFWRTDGTSGTWTGTNWSNPASATGGTAWTSGDDAEFSANSTVTFASTGVGNVTVDDGKTVTVTQAGTLSTGTHVFTIGTGSTLTWQGQKVSDNSASSFDKEGAGTWDIGAQANNYTGGFTLGSGTVIVTGAKSFGTATLNINGGTIQSSGGITFGVTSVVIGADFSFAGIGNDIWNQGVDLGSSTRTITNGAIASGGATRSFSGIVSGLSGAGLIVVGTGTGTIASTSTTILSGANTYSGGTTLNSGGILQLSGSGTLGSTSGPLTVNAGRLDLNGTSQGVGNLTGSGGTILNNANGTNVTLTIGNNNGTGGNYQGVIANNTSGTGTVALSKIGTGTITLSGANTYTGGTTITAGTLSCGAASVLPSGSAVTLNGGILKTGATTGFTQSTGTLNLAANSTIALGTGSHSLTFAASNAVSWTSGKTLTVTGWTGAYNGTSGTAGQIFVGPNSSGLTSGQLSQIVFSDGNTAYTATILSNGEVVPTSTPTDVAMMNFKATRYDKQVLLEWQTGYEVSNIGFNIYREKNGGLERITPEPVAGSALIAGPRVELKAGLAYSWIDEEEIADCGSGKTDCENRRYWIEDIDLNGRTTIHGPFGVSEGAIGGDQPGGELGDRTLLSKRKSPLLSALGRDASLAQTAEAATVPVEPTAKVAKITAARMTIQSGVASQTAVKLSVQREGWYRVEQSDLTAAGLPSDANPAMLQLLADGKEVPMLVTGATSGTGGGVIGGVIGGGGVGGGKTTAPPGWTGIEFYGLGINSPSTVNHVYWLVVGSQPGLRITTSDAKGGPVSPSSFAYTIERRDKTVYFPALKNGGAEKWFGPLMFNAQPIDQSVNVQHISPSGGALLLVSLQGFNNTAHTVRVLFNGVEVGTMRFTGLQKAAQKFVIQPGNIHEGVNQIQLIGPPGTSDLSMVEYVQLNYFHTNTADNNSLRMPATGQQQVTIDGFTGSSIRVMDVTDASSPVELKTTVNGAASKTSSAYSVTVVATSSGARTLLAFASDQQKRPAAVVANQPSSYRDPGQRADYVIITRKDLIGSFGRLADLRKGQNLLPMLIDIDDIYDEFSFGNKTPQALKDFLTYAKTSWARAPRFVVLAGDGTYDPKNYAGLGDFDLVPTRLVETAYNEAATDDWFADVNNDGVPDIAIGRLPVRTPAEAAAMVTKLVSYDAAAGTNNVLLVADRNSNFDFEAADTQLRSLIPASLTVTDIRRGQVGDATARTQLLAALNQGSKVVNYYGHGSTTVWTDAPMLSASDAAGLTNQNHLSLIVSMTCLNGYFHAPSIESLGESLLKAQGGAIAVWASSGLTDAQAQTVMSRDAISRLLNGSTLTIGEIVALAKASVTNLDVRRTWILLGDPATRLK